MCDQTANAVAIFFDPIPTPNTEGLFMLTTAMSIHPTEGDRCPSIAHLATKVARWQTPPGRSTAWATQAANAARRAIRRNPSGGIHPLHIRPGGAEFRLTVDHGDAAEAIADQMASMAATAGQHGLQVTGQVIDARSWEMRLQSISEGDTALLFFQRFRQSAIDAGLIVVDDE